ncbi:MAG: hypothetical protein H6Q74_2229 [Firmicutes bacterium]|nr:hypothetical protein [Bacillota bacterium]
METIILIGMGVAAVGYIGYLVWRGINGKNICDCGNSGACKGAAACHRKERS